MAGIYLHIPFCKTRCIYCDFYSSTRSELKDQYIQALCKELAERKNYLQGESVDTIYFGGGTPSQLDAEDFEKVFDCIARVYGMEQANEITLEANPDDLTPEYLGELAKLPFNRISIGIQTFNDNVLKLLKRRHTASGAIKAVEDARNAGFNNISIDLIYGLPSETQESWEKDLQQAIALDIEHISAYHLTYEQNTPIYNMLKANLVKEINEENSILFFTMLMDHLANAGYEHYEISNFCKPGKYSRHNTSYWQGIKYLGCGPSAHSFDGQSREWNTASIDTYITGIENHERVFEAEALDKATRYNDLIITTIRTTWGLSLPSLEKDFGTEYHNYALRMAQKHIRNGELEIQDNCLRLTRKGIFISDSIMSNLILLTEQQ